MKLYVKPGREYVLGGRVYRADDGVEVPDKFVTVLTSAKGPLQRGASGSASISTQIQPAPLGAADLAALRIEYEEVLGRRPFHAWGTEVLQEKIAQHRAASQSQE